MLIILSKIVLHKKRNRYQDHTPSYGCFFDQLRLRPHISAATRPMIKTQKIGKIFIFQPYLVDNTRYDLKWITKIFVLKIICKSLWWELKKMFLDIFFWPSNVLDKISKTSPMKCVYTWKKKTMFFYCFFLFLWGEKWKYE